MSATSKLSKLQRAILAYLARRRALGCGVGAPWHWRNDRDDVRPFDAMTYELLHDVAGIPRLRWYRSPKHPPRETGFGHTAGRNGQWFDMRSPASKSRKAALLRAITRLQSRGLVQRLEVANGWGTGWVLTGNGYLFRDGENEVTVTWPDEVPPAAERAAASRAVLAALVSKHT